MSITELKYDVALNALRAIASGEAAGNTVTPANAYYALTEFAGQALRALEEDL